MSAATESLAPAGPDDLDDLARLEAACLPDPWSRDEIALYLGSGALAGFRLVAAPDDRAALAFALFQLLPGEAELLRLGVAPEARGRGRGRRLLAAALEHLRAGGRPVCHLEVRAGNRPARGLYETLGFRLVGRRRAYYADGEDAVRYRLGTASAGG
ncbi:MAG TPA: GNAT family N-acetyltransferase [Thermoanaerobaculia bacterium]